MHFAVEHRSRHPSQLEIETKVCPHIGVDEIIDLRIVV